MILSFKRYEITTFHSSHYICFLKLQSHLSYSLINFKCLKLMKVSILLLTKQASHSVHWLAPRTFIIRGVLNSSISVSLFGSSFYFLLAKLDMTRLVPGTSVLNQLIYCHIFSTRKLHWQNSKGSESFDTIQKGTVWFWFVSASFYIEWALQGL